MKLPVWVLLLCAKSLLAQEPSALTEAQRALSEGIPQVAIVKLNAALADKSLSSDQKSVALHLLAEAQLGAGHADPNAGGDLGPPHLHMHRKLGRSTTASGSGRRG